MFSPSTREDTALAKKVVEEKVRAARALTREGAQAVRGEIAGQEDMEVRSTDERRNELMKRLEAY